MRWFWKIPLVGTLVYKIWLLDAKRKQLWLAPYLSKQSALLEMGSGPGSVLQILRENGHHTQAIDIHDSSFDNTLRPILYNGKTLPFKDDSFDAVLLLTMLHHTPDPDAILREALRVAPQLYIIEDIYTSPWHARFTKLADSITNLEFWNHPHSNKDDQGWRDCFKRLHLKLIHSSHKPMAVFFLQALYIVEREGGT